MSDINSGTTPDCGQRLLPSIFDDRAIAIPRETFVSIPRSSDLRGGFRDVTYLQFARAVNRCSWWIDTQLGRGKNFETITYMGTLDLMYPIMILAAVKTGYKVLFCSARNSLAAHLSLLQATGCEKYLFPEPAPPIVKAILKERQMQALVVPDLGTFLQFSDDEVPVYEYCREFSEARHEPLVVLHTSGSTGIPKHIVVAHGTFASMDAYQLIPSLGEPQTFSHYWKDLRVLSGFPLFHMGGYLFLFGMNLFYGFTCVLPPPGPLSAEVIDFCHSSGNVQASFLPPSTIVDLVTSPKFYDNLRRLQYIGFAGGPLPNDIGDKLSSVVRIVVIFGSTEGALYPTELAQTEDWNYIKYSKVFGHEYRHYADDISELVLVRNKEFDLFQSVFSTFPELQEFPTRDLYSEHPFKPGWWRYRGRSDDVIVFSNAEKLNPVDMEGIISSYPAVSGALIGGQGRFQSCLLVEPKLHPATEQDMRKFIVELWPVIERANLDCPAHGRIRKGFVIFTSEGKPMLRAGKGTVQRRATLESYREEFDVLYSMSSNKPPYTVDEIDSDGNEGLETYLRRLVCREARQRAVNDTSDLFELGFDSLQVNTLVKGINTFLMKFRKELMPISSQVIYRHSSIRKLNIAIESQGRNGREVADNIDHYRQVQNLYEEFSSDLPGPPPGTKSAPGHSPIVLLTGSTGTLGPYLLSNLISDPKVSKIICLNRSSNAGERQKKSHLDRGLVIDFDRVQFLKWDASQLSFGLDPATHNALLKEVTHVIHNAWEVNFNLSVDSFARTHIRGVRQFVEFSSHSAQQPFIFFISTIGAVQGWNKNYEGRVPERILEDPKVSEATGYAESKLVAEKLLAAASKKSGLRCSICRVGQIAGPTTKQGIWNRQEWFPSVIASSKYLGKLPNSLGPFETVDWIPVDSMAQIITELLWAPNSQAKDDEPMVPAVHHAVNPQITTWSDLLPHVRTSGLDLEVVSFHDWLEAVHQSASRTEDLAKNPALKLLDFLENMNAHITDGRRPVELDTTQTTRYSPTMASLGPVTGNLIGNWIRQWDL